MKDKLTGSIMLITATLIWGTSLTAQSIAASHTGPFTFNASRFLLGGMVLLPILLIKKPAVSVPPSVPRRSRLLIFGGIICGGIVFITASLQQIGIAGTTAGKAGFITSLYIVIVPALGLFFGRPLPLRTWGCIILAIAGMYLLCVNERFLVGFGDALILLCAFSTAVHILAIDYFSSRVDCVRLSCLQFFICGILSLIAAFIVENPLRQSTAVSVGAVLYTGIFSCGIAYTLQALGQKNVQPAATALILSFESVFSVLAGWIVLGERLNAREISGCLMMFAAITASQIPNINAVKEKIRETSP